MSRSVAFVFDHFYPDYSAGGPVTSLANLALTLKTTRDVRVISGAREFVTGKFMVGVKHDNWTEWNGVPVWYAKNSASVKRAMESLPAHSFVYLNGIFSWHFFVLPLWWSAEKSLQVVISPRGMFQRGALQKGTIRKKLFISLLSISGLLRKASWHATDREEREDIKRHIKASRTVTVIPNIPAEPSMQNVPIEKKPGSLRLVYFSLISSKKNLDFLLNVLNQPRLHEVALDIIGPVKDRVYWQLCLTRLEQIRNPGRITYKGDISPFQVNNTLSRYHFLALPTKGENFGHAIVEALGNFRPVIISDQTPWKDVGETAAGFSVALDPDEWERTLVKVLQWDQETYNKSNYAAIEYYKEKFNRQAWTEEYSALFQ